MTIDKNNNKILSAMVGAGKKEDNAFTGVVMGTVETIEKGAPKKETGLFGFHSGAQSFGFKEDGTAFIGTSGSGRINFNGSVGTIESGNYVKDKAGMLINLTEGEILTPNFKLTQEGTESQKGNIAGWDFDNTSLVAPNNSIVLYSSDQETEKSIAGVSSDA